MVKTLRANKNENAAAVFTICTEHKSKARNRDLVFISAAKFLPVPGY